MKTRFFINKIKGEFPSLKWKKYSVLTGSWDHTVVILDKRIVFRFPKKAEYQDKLQHETQLLHYLKNKVNVGIPDYAYLSKDKSLAGYELLKGQEISVSLFNKMIASEKENFAKQLASFLNVLHKTPRSIIKKYHVEVETPKKLYNWQVRDIKKFIFPRLNKQEIEMIKKYLIELKAALNSISSNTLKHGDLTQDNLLWDNKTKQLNIIDFSDRAFGDPASDFSALWKYGNAFINMAYNLYEGKKDKNFLYRSKLYYKRIPLFVMKDAFTGAPCTFEEGYMEFKKRFI